MKNKKLKCLDIIRLLISIIVLLIAAYLIISPFIAILSAGKNDDISGLIFIFSFVGIIISPSGILGFIRFFRTRKKDAHQRGFSVLGLLTIIGLFLICPLTVSFVNGIMGVNLGYLIFLLPVGYLICEIVEKTIIRHARKNKDEAIEDSGLKNSPKKDMADIKTSDLLYCQHCGKLGIDGTSNYCKFCGKKVK